jgi:steroid delta-isomerase-like uncharacterized protein
MSESKDLARRFYEEVFNAGDLDAIDQLLTPDFVDHEEGPPGTPDGIEGVKAFVTMYREAFPDIHVTIDDMVEEGDRIAVRATFTGTHDGEFMGVPASGRSIKIEAIDMVRVVDGKAAEHWGVTDAMGLMQQIGAIPEEAASQA